MIGTSGSIARLRWGGLLFYLLLTLVYFLIGRWWLSGGREPFLLSPPKGEEREENFYRDILSLEGRELEKMARVITLLPDFDQLDPLADPRPFQVFLNSLREKFVLDIADCVRGSGPPLGLLERNRFLGLGADVNRWGLPAARVIGLNPPDGWGRDHFLTYFLPLHGGRDILIVGRRLSAEWLRQCKINEDRLVLHDRTGAFLVYSEEDPKSAALVLDKLTQREAKGGRTLLVHGSYFVFHRYPMGVIFPTGELVVLKKWENPELSPFSLMWGWGTGWLGFSIVFLIFLFFYIKEEDQRQELFRDAVEHLLQERFDRLNEPGTPELVVRIRDRWREWQRRLLAAREEQNQGEKFAAIGQMATGIAHEINNPLGIILATAEYVLHNGQLHSSDKEELSEIIKQSHRCRNILQSLLTFARPTPIQRQQMDLAPFLAELGKQAERLKGDKAVEIRVELGGDLPLIQCDGEQLRQVLLNLLSNALQAIPFNGVVRLTAMTSSPPGAVVIHVADNGVGIPQEHQKNIFNPFFTLKEKGTGLGLAISYHIMRRLGGELKFHSVPSEGTTFTVILPITDPEKDD